MFGFLKDKLKKAVSAFTKSAKDEVHEEKVDDKQAIEKAKQDEAKKIAKKTSQKKPIKKDIPEPKKIIKKEIVKEIEIKETPKKELNQKLLQKEKIKEAPKETPKKESSKAIPKSEIKEELDEENQLEGESIEVVPDDSVQPKKKGFFSKLFGKKDEVKDEVEEVKRDEEAIDEEIEQIEEDLRDDEAIEDHAEETAKEIVEEAPAEPGFFGKIKEAFTKKQLSQEKFDELFWELEIAMLENNVAVEVIEKIKEDLKEELTSGKVSRMGVDELITSRLRQSIEELFDVETFDFVERIKQGEKPYKICIIGVNGSGKTTTLAKIIHLLKKNNLSCVVAASDTFRAAAIDQLKEHTDKLGVRLISQGYAADPAAVAFDAIKHAQAHNVDVVLIDTAGRLHSNTNLMAELEKVVRVAKPNLKIFVGESITGNDCVEQATVFNKLVGIDAIILSKADIDEKGGAAISVSYITKKPILYLGTGQTYDDLEPFDKEKIIESLDLE